jgi:cobalt-zinc-cadmium resistance protein CzcA
MLRWLIDRSLANRWLVLGGLALLVAGGLYAMLTIPVEAFPDLTNNQVVVVTEAPGMAPGEVEQQVTWPIELAFMGMPKQEEVRSLSKMGLSMVTVVFDDSVPPYFARQMVSERIQQATAMMPQGVQPILSPPSTAFGELYQYTLKGDMDAMQLKDLHEWTIKNQLRTVPGVSEINTWGGDSRQYQVVVKPDVLQQYGLTLHDIATRIEQNNRNFGGGYIEHSAEQYTLRGLGRSSGADDLGQIVVASNRGTPVLLSDVAEVKIGAAPRNGAVLRQGETLSGMVIMLKGENGKRVIEAVKQKIAALHLPEGVKLEPLYDQSYVIDGTLSTVIDNLLEGFLLVTAILLLFLGNVRAALLTASIIPFSMLVSFIGMRYFGISANLMSLGAIDFGMIVDGAVVMMENSVHRLEDEHGREPALDSVRRAAMEVARPMTFGVAIIIAVYLPILFLQGLEGRMFRPMAITVCAALLGSLLLALTAVPVFASFAFHRGLGKSQSNRVAIRIRRLNDRYERLLLAALAKRKLTVGIAASLLAAALGSLFFIGTEFMPRLDEGSILVETRKLPGISLTESVEISKRVEKTLRAFPEIVDVITKIGRPDFATEAMGINEGDIYVMLRPRGEWKRFHSNEALIGKMDEALAQIPGIAYDFTQPMAMRMDETVSGVKADLAIKVFGEDFRILEYLGRQIVPLVSSTRGAAEPQMEITSGVPELTIQVDRAALARYGLNVSDVEQAIEAVGGGTKISEVVEGQRRYPVALRVPDDLRHDPESIGNIALRAPGGEMVALSGVARVKVVRGPEHISREEGQRRIVVMSNVRGRDLGSFVAEVREKIDKQIKFPAGYFVEYGGQFENQQRATRRLFLVVPLALTIIMALLQLTFGSIRQTLLVLCNVPFALVGGIAALWLRGINLNLSASIGFIALFGVAVLNGIVLVSSINRLVAEGQDTRAAVVGGAKRRLRPVLMTALVASLGFLPMAVATSTGAEIQRPLATVVIGGLFSSTILTLILLPIFYEWMVRSERVRRPNQKTEQVPTLSVG